jgi:hypothetical protein
MAAAPTLATPQKIHVIQGEYHVSADSNVMLTTVLGSCVSTCLHDPVAGVGGKLLDRGLYDFGRQRVVRLGGRRW